MIRRIPARATLPGLLLLSAACSGSSGDGGEATPARTFDALEERLVEASSARFDFTVEATGAVEAALTGTLAVADGGRARLEAEGRFDGEEVAVLLVSDGRRMRLTNGADTVETEAPPELREALVLGLTRMGVLHNVARLVAAAGPDRADGGMRDWVRVEEVHAEEPGGMGFDLRVDGEAAGSAVLLLSPNTGLPAERRQTVRFPEPDGVVEMQVVERYGAVSVGAGAEPGAFEID